MTEKIFKRDNIEVKISAKYGHGYNSGYTVHVSIRDKGKRKWSEIFDGDGLYRSLDFPNGRKKYVINEQLKYVTIEEIQEVCLEEWENFKPVIGNYDVGI